MMSPEMFRTFFFPRYKEIGDLCKELDLDFWLDSMFSTWIQEGSPEEIREEVRFLIDTFDRQEGGMCIAAGNGIVSGTPIENIEAFLDEAVRYGRRHRSRYQNAQVDTYFR